MKQKIQIGFMLIEVVISLLIIIVVLVLYAAASNSVLLNRNAKHQAVALQIATSELEGLRNTAYDSLPSSGSISNSLLTSLPSGQATRTLNVYNAKTKEVVVTVTWKEPGNSQTHTVLLNTLINEHGL